MFESHFIVRRSVERAEQAEQGYLRTGGSGLSVRAAYELYTSSQGQSFSL